MLHSLINRRLGRYYIKELLGRGGMAAVYRASDTVLQRDVALKVLYPQYSDDTEQLARFQREAVTAAALEHPHIVPVYDVGEQDGMAFIAMKLLGGRTLHEYLQAEGAIEPDALIQLLAPVAAALDYAHSRGVVHRDIKPANIMLSSEPDGLRVMLADFGIARQLDTPGLTTTGALIGTPDYMAPEQIAGRAIDGRTDVYALGMLAFRALTGRRAFEGSTQDVLLGHLYHEAPAPSSIRPQLSPAFDTVILQAIAREPSARYPTAGAFVGALRQALRTPAPLVTTGTPIALSGTPAATMYATGSQSATAVGRPPALQAGQAAVPRAYGGGDGTVPPADKPVAGGEGRRNNGLWIVTVILATIAGGLAVALGFVIARGAGNPVNPPVGLIDTATATIVTPTLEATAAPTEETVSPTVEAQAPSPTVEPPTIEPPTPVPPTPAPPTATELPTATATATSEPPTATATGPPTATATPEPPTATPTPEVIGCDDSLLRGGFGRLYRESVTVRQALGCPTGPEIPGNASEQFFEQGMMYWWGFNNTRYRDTIFVMFGRDSGRYGVFPPAEVAAMPEPPPQDDPQAPKNGFGRIYYNVDGIADRLGTWISPEIELKDDNAGVIQFFDGGLMLYTPDDRPRNGAAIFVLYDDLTFDRYTDTGGG